MACEYCKGDGRLLFEGEYVDNTECPKCKGTGKTYDYYPLDEFRGPSCVSEGYPKCGWLFRTPFNYWCTVKPFESTYEHLWFDEPCKWYEPEDKKAKELRKEIE